VATTKIVVPEALHPDLTFRWFLEYIVDNSPMFSRASALAKVLPLLQGNLDPGEREVDEKVWTLIREAISSDESPLQMPQLSFQAKDTDGNPMGDAVPVPGRAFAPYVKAILG
jgi:hypothetical protein